MLTQNFTKIFNKIMFNWKPISLTDTTTTHDIVGIANLYLLDSTGQTSYYSNSSEPVTTALSADIAKSPLTINGGVDTKLYFSEKPVDATNGWYTIDSNYVNNDKLNYVGTSRAQSDTTGTTLTAIIQNADNTESITIKQVIFAIKGDSSSSSVYVLGRKDLDEPLVLEPQEMKAISYNINIV